MSSVSKVVIVAFVFAAVIFVTNCCVTFPGRLDSLLSVIRYAPPPTNPVISTTVCCYGDEYTTLCRHCYENHYTRCSCCDALLHENDAYHLDGYDYCSECYHDEVDKCRNIHDYGYKPDPVFYGNSKRFFGVELEIDGAGKDSDNADELLAIGNRDLVSIYIKGDGSLDDGMEIVTHPMSLDWHKDFCWEEIMKKAVSMGYRLHQTSTCGLHIHVNRNSLGDTHDEQ